MSLLLTGAGTAVDGGGEPIYWINCRGTQAGPTGFPGDGPNSSYSTGGAYPERSVGPFEYGWVAANTTGVAQPSNLATYEHQAGRISMTTGLDAAILHIEGFEVSKTYRLWASLGAINAVAASGIRIYSAKGSGELYSVQSASTIPISQMMDIQGTTFPTVPDWVSGQQFVDLTATTTSMYVGRYSGVVSGHLMAIAIQKRS